MTVVLASAGFLWGAWVFLFQEVLRPAAAPVNISLDLVIRPLKPVSDAIGNPQPVLLRVSAKNSSGKVLMIQKTYWVAYGVDLNPLAKPNISCKPEPSPRTSSEKTPYSQEELIRDINKQMSLGRDMLTLTGTASSRYQCSDDAWEVIGFGPLFDANDIKPGEEIMAQRIILVPKLTPPKDFKLLRVRVIIPSYHKRSYLADQDLIRVVGGIALPSKEQIQIGFCQAERSWERHGLRWFFDKFLLPKDRLDLGETFFQQPASRYCPTLMKPDQREKIGAQVFVSTYEIPLNVATEIDK